ncbi:MAG: hydrolase [Corynebacterium nuruki]|nr:hydrolase [Corynebacterium nuruki]
MNRFRPELHVTAETGVLEAPAGAVRRGSTLHVFHQFRPVPQAGARWAHQTATGIPYGWDVCDDIIAPRGDEADCLAGSAVVVDDSAVELFFVATDGDLATALPHNRRGDRTFRIERALIPDLAEITAEISDDPSVVAPQVRRLGPVDIDDTAHPVGPLVTPSVIRRGTGWLMLALSLDDDEDAHIVVLTSPDRQSWTVDGPLDVVGRSDLPTGRPFAPRIVPLTDTATGEPRDVLFVTYPDGSGETAGYLVGSLDGCRFTVSAPYQVLDHGLDFTRPRVTQSAGQDAPVLVGLVGTFPTAAETEGGTWANCLSVPRYLTLHDGHLYQDVRGLPRAVRSYTDRAAVLTAQLDVSHGSVTVTAVDEAGDVLLRVVHTGDAVTVTRPGPDGEMTRSAALADADSDTLTVLVDGPVCEVFADGGLVSLTSALPVQPDGHRFAGFRLDAADGARVLTSMESLGRGLERRLAALDDPAEQERLIHEAARADGELRAGQQL